MRCITNIGTRRRAQRGGTRKTTHKGYIYLRATSGLNDNLAQLAKCTKYAIHHKRSIILEMPVYSATDLSTVFDFSQFPVPIITNHKKKIHELRNNPIEPAYYGKIDHHYKKLHFKHGEFCTAAGQPLRFDLSKSYPSNTVLIYASGGGGGGDEAVNILRHIRLQPSVKEAYKKKVEEWGVPAEYISIHLRATDKKLNITNNITGMRLKDSNEIIKTPPTGNTHTDSLKKVDAFIKAHTMPVFVASDNAKLLDTLSSKYPSILRSNVHAKYESNPLSGAIHRHGNKDPENLKNALVDLLILAKAKAIMTSAGGYSRLAKKLLKHPDILDGLLS